MLIREIKAALEKHGPMSSRQTAFTIGKEPEMVEAGIELLISKKIIVKQDVTGPLCRNCAFKNSCSGKDPESHTLYKINRK